jgi:radical SAM superfamily enzyme YgiQ (UPF0313 family)
MAVQRTDMRGVLLRARKLGRRTILGGPFASSCEPELALSWADHVVRGEPDEAFAEIAADLERGTPKRLYVIDEKPDVSHSPVPRFDLLKRDKYLTMAVQFSRGCPFQCEFCDIITIYGRKPRTKSPAQLLDELDALFQLGWRHAVFIVDDNFIGNHKRALELALALEGWQKSHDFPYWFYTEASIDLAERPGLIEAMVKANFLQVFVGIESPSKEALAETRKFQNLRHDQLESIHILQSQGLWVMGGFIIGFDSDTEEIFDQQKDFIDRAAIPWAMAGVLQAVPTTPLYARLAQQGRLIEKSDAASNFDPPNFRTVLPLPILLQGLSKLLDHLYSPRAFYQRAYRSLLAWTPRESQNLKLYPLPRTLGILIRSVWRQGVVSQYRRAYWTFILKVVARWCCNPVKFFTGLFLSLSAEHFIPYARVVVRHLATELGRLEAEEEFRPVEVATGPPPSRTGVLSKTFEVVGKHR